jgi:hypothetical protein
MARFVSQHRNFSHGVRNGVPAHLGPDGRMKPEVTPLSAQFTPDLRTDEDLAFALSTFNFRGLPIYESGKEIGGSYRVSVFDSEIARMQNGWTEDDEAEVVAVLRDSSMNGTAFAELVPEPAVKPWNGYDEVEDAARILELALAIDADLQKVLQYETENQNRPAVVAELKAAIAAADETIVVSA